MLIADVPLTRICPHCGHEIMRLPLDMAYEAMVADVLQGELCTRGEAGIDIRNSRLFPGLAFQVKRSKAGNEYTLVDKNGRNHTYGRRFAFNGHATATADFYVLFGEIDEKIIPFLLSARQWNEYGAVFHKRRLLFIQADEFSKRCGRKPAGRGNSHIHRNRGWECVVHQWPDDLLRQIHDSSTLQPRFL